MDLDFEKKWTYSNFFPQHKLINTLKAKVHAYLYPKNSLFS
jgi:hypothetical protein